MITCFPFWNSSETVICPLYHQEVGFVNTQSDVRMLPHTRVILEAFAARRAAGRPGTRGLGSLQCWETSPAVINVSHNTN